ncbi:potassium channel family protein [uncultured Clostridium sp.]|uniref:potassium channel family protein n=1 Tax=uncultured Clostridium sp. TaxID=59620 RepID=UPI0026205DD1|nr:potassium channel family protein [uncultured Clostridium sp.]
MVKLINSKYYQYTITLLSLFIVITLFLDLILEINSQFLTIFNLINFIIWVILVFDYFIRLFYSENKISFIKSNKIDLISILPLNEFFKGLRIFKVTKLLKFTKFLKLSAFIANYSKRINKFMKLNNFNYVLYLTISTVLLGAISISIVENVPFSDAIWWSFVTTTTVGYGDISPTTPIGRIIATILMIIGIGFLSMLTGTIATFFIGNNNKPQTFKDETLEMISNKLKNDFDSIDNDELDSIFNILKTLKKEE